MMESYDEFNTSKLNYPIIKELFLRDRELFNKFENLLSECNRKLYPQIKAANPTFNDHGENHVMAIFKILSQMIQRYLVQVESYESERINLKNTEFTFRTLDLFALLIAVVIHDSFMALGRKNHGKNAINSMAMLSKFIDDANLNSSIITIATSHSDLDVFHKCKYLSNVNNGVISEKLIASLLRFADEVSEDSTRGEIDPIVFEDLIEGTESEIFWHHTNSILLSSYDQREREISINYKVDSKLLFKVFKTPKNIEMTLYDFIITRIKKVNDERVLCGPFISQFTQIDFINVTIEIFEDLKGYRKNIYSIDKLKISSYPNGESSIVEFIKAYPVLESNRIKEIIKDYGGAI